MMDTASSQAQTRLAGDATLQQYLPTELRDLVLSATGADFLEGVSQAALVPRCTERVFVCFEHLTAEIAARWIRPSHGRISTVAGDIAVLGCVARIYPLARYLRSMVKSYLSSGHFDDLRVQGVDTKDLEALLLAVFRLLSTEPESFSEIVKPTFLSRFFSHGSLVVRYLAIQCMCIVMRFADALEMKLIHTYIGGGKIPGVWEGKQIDFRLLKLLEEKRWIELDSDLKAVRAMRHEQSEHLDVRITNVDLSPTIASIGGELVPRDGFLQSESTTFVDTPTSINNIRSIGRSLLSQKPVLVVGYGGSGKTILIRESARLLNRLSSMITLYLNEQTDAKSLLGVYTSSESGESFVWQPGVLTKAVQQGRWVLIEDIDRAPSEVLGVLRPIIENGELFLPSRKERIRPSEGFRVFATIKTSSKSERGNIGRHAWLANERLWSTVAVKQYSGDEVERLLRERYPQINPLLSSILRVHEMVCELYSDDPRFRAVQGRLPSLRDLMKWCRRIDQRVSSQGLDLSTSGMPEHTKCDIFKDGVDCYAAYHSDLHVHNAITQCIAQVLHVSTQQTDHLLTSGISGVVDSKSQVAVGRSILPKIETRRPASSKRTNFAMTNQAKRTMDGIAAGITHSEPLLLVGETGVGKTTQVQHIANLVNQKLIVVNLSQQSEAADLLGGLKPITTRSLVIPLLDQFNTLFDDTFSSKRNEKFQIAISKSLAHENWARLVLLWQEAVQMAENSLKKPFETAEANGEGQSAKRRKLISKYGPLRDRWTVFSSKLNHVRAQVERGAKNHSFAFVEGRLVQAVRSGAWLLLDEINLASADTLDHVVGLLNNGDNEKPSLLLAEAGSIEQITAHPSFRIFAAMNPATDTGKKDLAPGIRSRFTEIYVQSGDNDIGDLTKIIETYLGSLLSSDRRAATDLARAYLQLKTLNEEHRLTDGAGDVPHFSIRSLVRCLLYMIQHSASHGLRRSMYEGFAMSFFTVLSLDSEKLALPLLTTHLLANVKNPRSFLSQQPNMTYDPEDYVAFGHHLVRRGPDGRDSQPHYIRTPSVERNLINLARAASMRRFPILLQGPTSAGKTSMVEYLAKFSGNRFVRINNHEHTDLQEYLGSYATGNDGRLDFREGVLVEALRQGYWVVLDELNLAPSDVLEALNRLLDDNRELLIPESQEIVRPHPNFMLFATQNPAGLYGGRKRLSRAFRNRFLELHFDDLPEDELEDILRERAQIAPSFCTQIVQVYKKLSLQRQSTRLFESRNSFATLRDLFRWAARSVDDRQQLARHGFMLLAERVRDPSERNLVRRTIEQTMKVKLDENELYGSAAIPGIVQANPSVVWTLAMRRLFVLVSEALKNNEPVLLVGETGCGKTQICQTVAQAFRRNLNIYNAHSNTETGDLIGSQRPIRQRSELASALLDNFSQLYALNGASQATEDKDVDEMIDRFQKMDKSTLEPSAIERIRQNIAAYQSLFAWSDGSLVRSMKSGEHFLLDEISLADDSVLERLNSVLEPSRTILLAEKGPKENFVVADPSFQFLATMNPGGDYGKRELSAALRNRLTEIWVPPLSDEGDILPILQAKLGKRGQDFAQAMLNFATWFKDNMQNSAASTIPLRSLLAWAEFVRNVSGLDPDIAFVHAASMVYIDSLGANPAGLTNALGGDLHTARNACLHKLQEHTTIDVLALYNEVPQLQLTMNKVSLGPFQLLREPAHSDITDLVFDAPTTLRNAMRIVRALQMNRPVLLEGSPGVGKTAIVTALAALVGKDLTRINLSDQTDLMDLFGADAPSDNEKLGRFAWRDGPLLQAMQTGGWVLLDEMNLATQSVLEGLNSCLDHRHEVYIAELDKSFICHPEFTLFAAQNPHHQGGGRKGLPASFVNRFTVVYTDSFEREDLMLICQRRRPEISNEHLSVVVDTISNSHDLVSRSPVFGVGGPWELNLRDVNRWLDLIQEHKTLSAGHHFGNIVVQRFRSANGVTLLNQLREEYIGQETEPSLYHNLSQNSFQIGTSFLERDPQLQYVSSQGMIPVDHLPCAQAAITAINHNWPLILVGPSGCGKTTLLRNLAALSGSKLVEFSMNADIDTMDLIGGFEQYDPRRDVLAIQIDVCNLLIRLICEGLASKDELSDIHMLAAAYEHCSITEIQVETLIEITEQLAGIPAFHGLRRKLAEVTSKSTSSRFVWNDGILIDALQDGSWLVLDNANLCNPSVLDRLNSLLEPNGVLTVSEQHSGGTNERIVQPHPRSRIFLTMDPRSGELSRAMRNRSLELFMDTDSQAQNFCSTPLYTTSASMYRTRTIMPQLSLSESDGKETKDEPYVGALSATDTQMVADQVGNITNTSSIADCFRLRTESYMLLAPAIKNVWHQILSGNSGDNSYPNHLRHLDSQDQPQTFILNDALIQLLVDRSHLPAIEIYALHYFIETRRARLQQMLIEATEAVLQMSRGDMTILQKSIVTERRAGLSKREDVVPDAYGFLTTIVNQALKTDSLSPKEEAVLRLLSLMNLAKDIFDLFDSRVYDLNIFQAYLRIAHGFLQELPSLETNLRRVLEKALSHFGSQFVLQSGQSLQRMWLKWKPDTAATQKQVDAQISIEKLLEKFDHVAKRLPFRRRELAGIRSQLSRSYTYIKHDPDSSSTVVALTQAIEALAMQHPLGKLQSGHFTLTFEWALRKLIVQGKKISELDFQRLSLYTESLPMTFEQTTSTVSGTLCRLAYLNSQDAQTLMLPGSQLLVDLTSIKSEPLSLLDHVQEELKELASTISCYSSEILVNDVYPVLDHVRELLFQIMICHDDLFTAEARTCFTVHNSIELDKLAQLGGSAFDNGQSSQVGYFKDVYCAYLLPVIVALGQGNARLTHLAGACLVTVCIAALKLMVPDKAFDPAIYPAVVSQRHQKRMNELYTQIDAYRTFQRSFTGQRSSTVISMFEKELMRLGEAPPTVAIVRPAKSELQAVQQEFLTVLKNVVDANQLNTVLSYMSAMPIDRLETAEACRVIQILVSRVVERLARLNRTYDDIVKPVMWLLESLSFGTKMISSDLVDAKPISGVSIFESIPLLGGTPEIATTTLPRTVADQKRADMRWLEHIQFQGQVERGLASSDTTNTTDFVCLADKFYVEWKTRLTKDQAEAEAKSKYYAYRGKDDIAEELDESELMSVFPTYENDLEHESDAGKPQYDARSTSVRLAALHSKLYSNDIAPASLRDHILHALEAPSTISAAQLPDLRNLLPGILLLMKKSTAEMEKLEATPGLNIYTDGDVVESRKLISLVRNIQTRFREISAQWPEHAVPAEVLSYSDELMAFKINEPIAKLLTKTEKLFEIISQWQSVASREWSAAVLMEALTDMIIHWRRLELSSWSRLLDIEKKKCEEDANAWYFIAYEAVLYNSRLVVDQNGDTTTYCQELARTLEDFLTATTIGQFASRLSLLTTFEQTLNIIVLQDKRLAPIAHCVTGVLFHYNRYEASIQQALYTGRAQLEKNITEQIQLASWKDTNVRTLRDSARRSHHNLFKIVRKFRALLAQPLVSFKSMEVDMTTTLSLPEAIPASQLNSQQLELSLQQCATTINGWESRPERLTKPVSAAISMKRLYNAHATDFSVSEVLISLRIDVAGSAAGLRKQTPQTLSKENTSLVRYLKERKRRLFAETLRSAVQMGIRRNLATVELARQSSVATVLAYSPEVSTSVEQSTVRAVNAAFHEILDNMPGVRKAANEHSADLTEGETRRAIGLLEGLLSVEIAQRADLAFAASSLQAFQSVLESLKHMQMLAIGSIDCLQHDMTSKQQWIEKCLAWLPHVLEVSCQVLEFQSAHGGSDVGRLVEVMRQQMTTLTVTKTEWQKSQPLPAGLTTLDSQDRLQATETSLVQFGVLLEHWKEQQPNLVYLLEQIIRWTRPSVASQTYTNGIAQIDIDNLDTSVRRVLDSVFVALQNVATIKSSQPESVKDQGWLVKATNAFHSSFKALHLGDLANQLNEAVGLLQHLSDEQFNLGISVFSVASPVLEQYFLIAKHIFQAQLNSHYETCRLGVFLTKSFVSIASEGFCTPHDPADGQDQQSGKLESGTGLGEGEGAEDISKDVGDDEDLSELAQAGVEQLDGNESMDKQRDAVDMGADDLEGAMGSGDESASDDETDDHSGSDDEDAMDEEAGSVDDLDPSAVDEKLWDDMQNQTEKEDKEMKGDKQKGQKSDEQIAKEEGPKEEGDEDMQDTEEGEDENEVEDDEIEGKGRPEVENLDPHLQEEEALDLPEEMQLNGEDAGQEDEISDDGMDKLSNIDDMDQPVPEQVEEINDEVMEDRKDAEIQDDEGGVDEDAEAEGEAQDDEVVEDQAADDLEDDKQDTLGNEMLYEPDENEGGDTGTANQRNDKADEDQDENAAGQNDKDDVVNEQQTQAGKASDTQQTGDASRGTLEQGVGRENEQPQSQDDALKNLADVLEQYHQRREILTASEERKQGELDRDIDMGDADFEHMGDDEQDDDAQALGAASADQVQQLDESKAIEHQDGNTDEDLPMPEDQDMADQEQQETLAERFSRLQSRPHEQKDADSGALLLNRKPQKSLQQSATDTDLVDEDIEDDEPKIAQLPQDLAGIPLTSDTDAAALWSHCSMRTYSLSLLLTEQLRLILAPTTATKLRGDFRTGKRLNIKRIIPYIASGYKRDKIWMRRSVPSKRNYQIMIAVDDSKSMSESGADLLAFETVAMLCKSLSMLDVGELCVVGFGEEDHIRVAHQFGQPFTGADSGLEVFKNFSFQQRGTDVRKLLRQSISIFDDARLRSNNDDLWQLQLIVSDGHCSDHDSIRRLVRAAHERKIMIVFVIVDAGQDSIVDLKEAVFERVDPTDERSEMKVKTKKYLEGFPFGYYVVVREVADLPGVLARVLRGWFEGVVNVG